MASSFHGVTPCDDAETAGLGRGCASCREARSPEAYARPGTTFDLDGCTTCHGPDLAWDLPGFYGAP